MDTDERAQQRERLMDAEHVIIALTDALMVAQKLLHREGDVHAARRIIADAVTKGRAWLKLPGER
jgi:hypothetical protein